MNLASPIPDPEPKQENVQNPLNPRFRKNPFKRTFNEGERPENLEQIYHEGMS